MSIQEADECAAQIVEIFGLMSRARPTVVQLHSVDSSPTALIVNN